MKIIGKIYFGDIKFKVKKGDLIREKVQYILDMSKIQNIQPEIQCEKAKEMLNSPHIHPPLAILKWTVLLILLEKKCFFLKKISKKCVFT